MVSTIEIATLLPTYGFNNRRLTVGYDMRRQQMTSLNLRRSDDSDTLINKSYDFYNGGNNNGRIQKITDNIDASYTTTYGYDDYNRLTNASASSYGRTYTHDNWGNLTGATMTGAVEAGAASYSLSYANNASGAPATNRINNAGFGYDAAGNQTGGDGWTYAYDAANRLKSAGGGGDTYGYDGDGRKVVQTTGGNIPIYYLWSSVLGEPVAEMTTYGVYRAYAYNLSGQQLGVLSYDGVFYWVHANHLGSGHFLTTQNGNVAYHAEYDPHGQTVLETSPVGTYVNSKKFTGYERNWATGLDYAKARNYQRTRERFTSPLDAADAMNPQSLNRYM